VAPAEIPPPVDAPGADPATLALGAAHTCRLVSERIWCWGDNGSGQLGDRTTTSRAHPVLMPAEVPLPNASYLTLFDRAIDVTAGDAHTCAIGEDRYVFCWGRNDRGQTGGAMGTTLRPDLVRAPRGTAPDFVRDAIMIEAGAQHTCALIADGSVACWGANEHGQLGRGTRSGANPGAREVPGLARASQISAGGATTCIVTDDRTVQCWGAGERGQIGDGRFEDRSVPTTLALTDVVRVAVAADHVCALLGSGRVNCWGNNDAGQLGDGTTRSSARPTEVTGLTGATLISSGDGFSCAGSPDDRGTATAGWIDCWGRGDRFQTGDGTTANRTTPVPTFQEATNRIDVVNELRAGSSHACIAVNRTVLCWGGNSRGQVGDGTALDRPTPLAVSGLPGRGIVVSRQ